MPLGQNTQQALRVDVVSIWYGVLAFIFLSAPCFSIDTITRAELLKQVEEQGDVLDIPALPDSVAKVRAVARRALARANKEIRRILETDPAETSFSNTVIAFDSLIHDFFKAINLVQMAAYLRQSTSEAEEAEKQALRLTHWSEALFQNKDVYNKVAYFRGLEDLSEEQKRLLDLILFEFNILPNNPSGTVGGWEVTGVVEHLETARSRFLENISQDSLALKRGDLLGLNEKHLAVLALNGEQYTIQLDREWQYELVLKFCKLEDTRRRVWEAVNNLGSDSNRNLVDVIAAGRARLAGHFGHSSWAARQLERLSVTQSGLLRSLEKLKSLTAKRFELENKEMEELLGHPPHPWDLLFAIETRNSQLGIRDEQIRQYLPLETVLQGLFLYCGTLLDLRIVEISDPGLWDPSARLFAIYAKSSSRFLGAFAIDLHSRPDKENGFFELSPCPSYQLPNVRMERPFSVLVGALAPATIGQPTLLSVEEMMALAHELGHTLHDVLDSQKYSFFSDTGPVEDLIEFPSTVFENLVIEPAVLGTFAKHWKTGKAIRKGFLKKIARSRKTFQVAQFRRDLANTLLDLKLHSERPGDARRIERRIYEKVYYPLPETVFLSGSHEPFGGDYDALYWTYLLAQGMAAWEVQRLKAVSPTLDDPGEGRHLRENFLELGSRVPSKALIRRLFGREFRLCPAVLLSISE